MRDDGSELPALALTLGDSAGIGPELVLQALREPSIAAVCRLVVYGNRRLLERVSAASATPFVCGPAVCDAFGASGVRGYACGSHLLLDHPFAAAERVAPGRVQESCGRQAYHWIAAAVADALRGAVQGVVTAPLNKAALHLAEVEYPGHTEMIAAMTGGATPCMAFYSDKLFVALATIHEALAAVPRLLTVEKLLHTIQATHQACQRLYNLRRAPRIGVLALNPHAGEGGLFGTEERTVITPAIQRAQAVGITAVGPLVPDTAFTWVLRGAPAPCDAYVAMYHDQALIPFKMVAFDSGVNLTLGLPIIRTSPDHGTAFDLAWQGRASPTSLYHAIKVAARIAQPRVASMTPRK